MGTNSFGNKSSMQPMKGSAWTRQGSSFIVLGRRGGGFFLLLSPSCSLYVPMRFQKGSPSSQNVPNSTSLLAGFFFIFPWFPTCSF